MHREARGPLPLPTRLLGLPVEPFRHRCHLPDRPAHPLLRSNEPGQDMGVHPPREDLELVHPGALHRHAHAAQRQWPLQHGNRFHHRPSAGKSGLDTEHEAKEQDHGRAGVHIWPLVSV